MFKPGTKVEWKWLGRKISGFVLEVHADKIVRTIKGKNITRKGSEENLVYLVESEAGNLALKLGSELSKSSSSSGKSKSKTKAKLKTEPALFSK